MNFVLQTMAYKRGTCSLLAALMLLSGSVTVWAGGVVAVDQAGYTPKAKKIASVMVFADSFHVLDAATRQVVLRDAMKIASLRDASVGSVEVYGADFSSLQQPGDYVVLTSAGDSSQHFTIADTVYEQVYRKSLKGYFYQRCGMALSASNAGAWSRAVCHAADATFHPTAQGTGTKDVRCGWHDAGDYGRYVVNAGITVGTLLAGYEWFPGRFGADDLNIPESGNGVPDILDEVRYELDWLLKMQNGDGGVFFKVTHAQFEGFIMPSNDAAANYIYQISSTATGDFVAVMARAARVYRPFDSTFAGTCLAAAVNGWAYLQAHSSIVPSGGFRNPQGTATGEYGDGTDGDERLWAAAELYLANGDATAHAYFTSNYTSGGIITGTMAWPWVKPLAELAYLRGSQSGINTQIQGQIRQSLKTYCNTLLMLHDNSGFGTALGPNDYYWGSNSGALNNAVMLIMGVEEGGSALFSQAALDQLHYILGTNIHGQSFVTGIGAKRTMHPHHRPSAADGIAEPVPGLLSGGPNHSITDDPVLQAHFTSATPPALCYIDDQGSYASNEICLNWNAPLVFVSGFFAAEEPSTSVGDASRAEGEPAAISLLQNYPNPFNATTSIDFVLPHQEQVDLRVVDVLGRIVAAVPLGARRQGNHRIAWRAVDAAGRELSTGLYFYYLTASGRRASDIRKLLLVK